jgi:hypothetical protein
MRQLMFTARMLEAEWRQVLWGSMGQRKMSKVPGVFGLLDFITLRPVLAWRMFWDLWPVYCFSFQVFSGCNKPQITETTDTESVDTGAQVYWYFVKFLEPNRHFMLTVGYSVCYSGVHGGFVGSSSSQTSRLLVACNLLVCSQACGV